MRIVILLILVSCMLVSLFSSCDKDDAPPIYFDANGCESAIPISDFSNVSLSWDGIEQRVDTVSHSVEISPNDSVFTLFGLTLSASCNINQLWGIVFNESSIGLDTNAFCSLTPGCNIRFLDAGEISFSFSILNFDEILASYSPIEHSSNFFYVEREGGEGSDMIFSYEVHLKQNGSFASRDIYPDTLIMGTQEAKAFFTPL